VEAVKRFVLGKPVTAICRDIFHSPASVERYITTFSRVVFLQKRGFTGQEIAFIIKASVKLVEDYILLLNQLDTKAYKSKLDEIAHLAAPFFEGDVAVKKNERERR